MSKISIDHPGHVDQLGRTAFARHVLDLIARTDLSHSGVVIGLEGKWGSGKTRVLNSFPALLEEYTVQTRPCLINFNPWMVSGTHGLVEALLLQMSAGLASSVGAPKGLWQRLKARAGAKEGVNKGAAIASSLIEYASILGTVKHFAAGANLLLPGAGLVLGAIGEAAESAASATSPLTGKLRKLSKHPAPLSLTQRKARLDALLRDFGPNLIVVIDDLDRLPPDELASMVQATKAVADFPNVAYVLAYDPDVAASALKEGLKVADGRLYLEKIVQLPVPMPEIPARRIMTFGMSRLQEAVDTKGLDAGEVGDLSEVWPLAAALMETPRDIERLRTRLLVSSPILRNVVNLADVVLLEAIALKAPGVISWVPSKRGTLLISGGERYDSFLYQRGTTGATPDKWVRQVEPAEGEAAPGWESVAPQRQEILTPLRSAMAFLFTSERNWDHSRERKSPRRAQQFRFWYRWRCYHDHHDTWDVSEVAAYLRRPSALIKAGIHAKATEFHDICQLIWSTGRDNIQSANSLEFVEFIRLAAMALGRAELDGGQTLGIPIWALVLALSADAPESREQALSTVVETCPLWLSGRLLQRLHRQIKQHAETGTPAASEIVYIDEAQQRRHSMRWRDLARGALIDGTQANGTRADLSPYYLLLWMLFLDEPHDAVRDLAERLLLGGACPIDTFFGDFCQGDESHVQLNDVPWHCLPPVEQLINLAEQSPEFGAAHGYLLRLFRARLDEKNGANQAEPAPSK